MADIALAQVVAARMAMVLGLAVHAVAEPAEQELDEPAVEVLAEQPAVVVPVVALAEQPVVEPETVIPAAAHVVVKQVLVAPPLAEPAVAALRFGTNHFVAQQLAVQQVVALVQVPVVPVVPVEQPDGLNGF